MIDITPSQLFLLISLALIVCFSDLTHVLLELRDVGLQFRKLLDFDAIRVFKVVEDVDQEIGEYLVSDEPMVVEGHVEVSQQKSPVLAMPFGN